MSKNKKPLRVETLTHDEATRKNAPTAELETFVDAETKRPIEVAYERRNRDLDPQLVWRGKDVADWSDLVVEAPPLYIQEKIHPKALIEDLKRASQRDEPDDAPDLFADFNGVDPEARTEFYAHDQHWSNRMILGDGLKVMASLAERERLKGQVQCIYIDPPYGIKFNSNFQWSTTSRDVKDGKADHLTREPEQVKAFRDTWADGIHSYLTYLRDRLTVASDLLTESGSVFVQIGDENVHRVRALMDEVFGEENFVGQIGFEKTSSTSTTGLAAISDYLIWFARSKPSLKFRSPYQRKVLGEAGTTQYTWFDLQGGEDRRLSSEEIASNAISIDRENIFACDNLTSQRPLQGADVRDFEYAGREFKPGRGTFKTDLVGLTKLAKSGRLRPIGNSLMYKRFLRDFDVVPIANYWTDVKMTGFSEEKSYVVQTGQKVVQRCILMTTDPGDLVLDPTCGSGTTAYVAEQWGRRWITIDTSRVALALARARIMGARYPWYLLADSREGQVKEGEITRTPPRDTPTQGRLRQGFVYKRVPHITLKSIANNAEIDTIWEEYQEKLEPLRAEINALRSRDGSDPDLPPFEEWTMPREPGSPWPEPAAKALEKARNEGASDAVRSKWLAKLNEELGRDYKLDTLPDHPVDPWNDPECEKLHAEWWKLRIERQQEIDASIAAKADTEYLYDQPYEDKSRVRVAGPFTVESLSPHRVPAVDVDDSLFDEIEAAEGRATKTGSGERVDFAEMVLDNLKRSGVQQRAKDDKLAFEAMKLWPGEWIVAEGIVRQKSLTEAEDDEDSDTGPTRRAAIFVGPEYGTVSRTALTAAAREAMDAGFDLLIAAAFNFDAHASELTKMGPLTVLQARINPDLHMPDLANTGAGNLFTVFGEPDIVVHDEGDGEISIEVLGVDMYKGGQIESGDADDIAVWFIDTDYNYESFFVRHAYFPGANDPYKALKTTLKAEVDQDAWDSLNRTRSRVFARPKDGRVAVKVVNHLGDEVMKVLEV
ncbi:site-specific DNA-methyltransferase [Sphingorhabdus sp. 109]|jgi:adenine-specific DNA-methyltransferase|uniref:site-specific DNA-methyltransferase n=1 Tax=Sphingorhabdus sp. 109 TaxID=2653173 RepID=UPI0012F1B8DE|nr:site-specific DNA-methyltransferase [Sphingorhabdus sp. 109]VWX57315.1 Site-specific DNA-methyltransferase [Sphingorhabdus sp. 109]